MLTAAMALLIINSFSLSALCLCSKSLLSLSLLEKCRQLSYRRFNVTTSNIDHTAPTFDNYGFADFAANYTGTMNGQAGFGNTAPPVGGATNTSWAAGTDLALQTTVALTGSVIGDVTLNLATDNGAIVFINGIEVFSDNAEGYTSIWEYTSTVSGALFNAGANTISVLTEDHGGLTFFDMELLAQGGISSAVPEPSMLALFSAGLLGIGFARRRRS